MYSCVLLMGCRYKHSRARGLSTIYIRHGIIQLCRCNSPLVLAATTLCVLEGLGLLSLSMNACAADVSSNASAAASIGNNRMMTRTN